MRLYRSTTFPVLGAILILALLTALLFSPLLGGGVLYFGDISLYFVPLLDFQRGELSRGRIPLWNPYMLCGTPFVGNPQAWPLYPSSLLLYFFSAEQTTGFIGALHVFMAGVGTLLFLRRRHLGTGSALLGAIAWSFGGALVAKMQFPNMVQAAAYLPWLLWAIEGVLSARQGNRRAVWLVLLAALVGLSLLAAHAQVFLLNFYLPSAWLIWRIGLPTNRERCRAYVRFIVAVAHGIGLACVYLLPVVEFTRVTVRADLTLAEANRFILPPYTSLYNFLAPNFFGNPATNAPYVARGNFWETAAYIGLLPFALAVGATICLRRKSAEARFWSVAAVVCCWLALGADAYLFAIAYYVLPGVRLFHDPARWLLPGTFALACLAAHGADAVARSLSSILKRRIFLGLALALTAADVLLFSSSLNPTTPRENFGAARKGTAISGRTYLSNYGELWGEFVSFRSYDAVGNSQQVKLFLSSQGPNLPVLQRQPMLLAYEPVRRSDVDRYLAAVKDGGNEEILLASAGVTEWQRYHDTGSETKIIPGHRAVFWNGWQSAETDEDALVVILSDDWRGRPIVTGLGSNTVSASAGEPLLVHDHSPQLVSVSPPMGGVFREGLVVLHDTHGAGWNVRVDGKPEKLRTVNGIFKGVLVPTGAHQAQFRYEPVSFRCGLFVSLCAGGILSGVFACAIASRYRERGQ